MKKLLSVILVGILAVSSVAFSASAAENEKSEAEIEREKLGWILTDYEYLSSVMGNPMTYFCVDGEAYNAAYNIYHQEEPATAEEYKSAKDKLYTASYNLQVSVDYAKAGYEKACKEQNYNNWYSDEQWSEFQTKLANLKAALTPADGSYTDAWAVTKAYNELISIYNKMTNAYTLKGDVNRDGSFDIMDVTLVQKYVVHEVNFTGAQKMLTNEKKYESDITVATATNLQKNIIGIGDGFKNNYIFIDEQGGLKYFDDTMRWYAYGNYNISSRYGFGTYGPYVNNDHTDFFVVLDYARHCEESGYEK